jgi:hypothetical protein
MVVGMVANGTRQRVTFASSTSVAFGDSGSPVVTAARPDEVVGLVSASLGASRGGVATIFDRDDLAFVRSAVAPATRRSRTWIYVLGAVVVLAWSLGRKLRSGARPLDRQECASW